MDRPLISIVVPVYNVENYIEQCARSLLEQTLNDIEYIFIDDCSTDGSYSILQDVINEYPNRISAVRLLQNSENLGVARTREKGILMSTGKYINTCDSDDWFDLEMFKSLYDIARSQESNLVISDKLQHDANGETHILRACENDKNLISSLLMGKTIPFICTCIFSREILLNPLFSFPVSDMGDDMLLSLELAFFFDNPTYIPCSYYHYRYNPQSITKSKGLSATIKRFKEICQNTNQIIGFLVDNGLEDKYSYEILHMKHVVKTIIWPVVGDLNAYRLWKTTYPEIVPIILQKRYYSFRTRLMYLLTNTYLYPLYLKIRNWIRTNG